MNKDNKKFVISSACVLALVLLIVGIVLVVTNSKYKVVSIPIQIEDNPGVWGGQLIYTYDSESMEYISSTKGNVFDECEVNDKEGTVIFLITQSAIENTEENGLIATIKLKVKGITNNDEYKITIDEKSNFCNAQGEYVYPKIETGTVTVEEK